MQTVTKSGVEALTLYGQIVSSVSVDLNRSLSGVLASGTRYIILDLSSVTYIDDVAVNAIADAMRKARSRRGDVLLLWPVAHPARRLLQLYMVDRVFAMFETLWEAYQHIDQMAANKPLRKLQRTAV